MTIHKTWLTHFLHWFTVFIFLFWLNCLKPYTLYEFLLFYFYHINFEIIFPFARVRNNKTITSLHLWLFYWYLSHLKNWTCWQWKFFLSIFWKLSLSFLRNLVCRMSWIIFNFLLIFRWYITLISKNWKLFFPKIFLLYWVGAYYFSSLPFFHRILIVFFHILNDIEQKFMP